MAKEYILKDRYGKDHTFNDEKIYVRGTDGELMPFTQGTVEPLTITESGTYTAPDGVSYNPVNVNVEPVLQDKTITENGEYTADAGYDGLGKVLVEIPDIGSDAPFTTITVTAKRNNVVISGATVTAVNGSETVKGVTKSDGTCTLKVAKSGTWNITVSKDGSTTKTSTYVSFSEGNTTVSLFYATITIACEMGATVTLEKPDGSVITETATSERTPFTVYNSGTYTATVTLNGITKTDTIVVDSTIGKKYQANLYATHLDLEETSWAQISAISSEGNAANYFSVGDTKSVKLNGTVGYLSVNATYYVYIIGINHNAELEGNGIHFGCFKTETGVDIALVDSYYGYSASTSSTTHSFRHWKDSSKWWCESDLRSKILGSTGPYVKTDSSEAPTATRSKSSTLLGIIPTELYDVMKPVTKYVYDYSFGLNAFVKDYFSLLSSYEITGTSNQYTDDTKAMYSTYSRQYEYYANGASKIKYKHNAQTTACIYWLRDTGDATGYGNLHITESGAVSKASGMLSYGLAPIFVV